MAHYHGFLAKIKFDSQPVFLLSCFSLLAFWDSFSGSVTIITPQEGAMELNSSSFDEIIIEDVEITDYKLTPYRNDDDPYFAECPDCGQPIGIHNDGGNGFCAECAKHH